MRKIVLAAAMAASKASSTVAFVSFVGKASMTLANGDISVVALELD